MTRTYRFKIVAVATALAAIAAIARNASASEIHVAKTGDDHNRGGLESPFLTIGKAAAVAQPGDTVTVHGGTYREWVKPPRGGKDENSRIVYRAAAGEEVLIKGSEQITSWVHQGDGVWMVELPNRFFGDYNPYALTISGGWLLYGQWLHRGDVYLDGEAFREQKSLEEVKQQGQSWYCQATGDNTRIWANFGNADPNARLAEINVRESVFMPEQSGLKYITVDGFRLSHSAENWQPPGLESQTGLIGPRMGKHWIIENCTVTNARCVGISLGQAPGVDYADIDAFGAHIVRNNVVRRCGEAGIAGQKGATRCLVAGNLIEETNYRKEFGGWETAAIKFHESVDTVIRGNLIRGVYYQKYGAFGIWMDWGNQGTRISGNIIYDTQAASVFLEMNHGPILVDNNVLIGQGVRSNSEGCVFAHNLLVDCKFEMVSDTGRSSQYYQPHTRILVARKHGVPADDKWYNNIFVRRGLEGVKQAPGYASDYNAFVEGAEKSSFGDEHSIVDSRSGGFSREDSPLGVSIRIHVNEAVVGLKGPWVDGELIGALPTVRQTIEDAFGRPIRVDADMFGRKRAAPAAGPLASLAPGENALDWSAKSLARSPDRPNILWITSEDNSPYLGCYGDPLAHTPNLDRLAAEGVRYRHAFANAPVCSSARTTLITGMYASSLGAQHHRSRVRIPEMFPLYPVCLREAGYYCTNNSKTDYNLANAGQPWDESSPKAHYKNRRPGQPFFAIFNLTTSHESQVAPKPGKDPGAYRVPPGKIVLPPYHPDTPEIRLDWANYYDQMTRLDEQVGGLLAELEKAGLAGETIVFYYSDHGGALPRGKRNLHDSGTRVPLVIRFPAKWAHLAPAPPGAWVDRLVSFVDFPATLLSLGGAAIPGNYEGRAFLGEQKAAPREHVFLYRGRMDERYDTARAIRDRQFRYIRNYSPHRPWGQHYSYPFQVLPSMRSWHASFVAGGCNPVQARYWGPKPPEELYDVAADPFEIRNLAGDPRHAARLAAMRGALRAEIIATRDTGFIPEGMFGRLAGEKTIYEYAQSGAYPIERIVDLADKASSREVAALAELVAAMDDPHPIIRYWGAVGCLVLQDRAAPAKAKLLALLGDDWGDIRIVAAEALTCLGEGETALEGLASELDGPEEYEVLAALNALDFTWAAGNAPLERIQAILRGRKFAATPDRIAKYLLSQDAAAGSGGAKREPARRGD